ncbi:hypothetical protein [endosymbiont DhMRE of Dentiscutata heterogama]|uniref:hypothetical protein n=1 Tax=endosymbiont DhMRE of Dentiscutata heterogama TaxID=1609546 RepID=UPI002AD44AE2|nr:hypothetical protein [endosymbiont DhMRE of Dentiscutata heterogama]
MIKIILPPQLTQLTSTVKERSNFNYSLVVDQLNNSLELIKPDNSETTQIITYVLVGTVVAGLLVYHYIRNQENLD